MREKLQTSSNIKRNNRLPSSLLFKSFTAGPILSSHPLPTVYQLFKKPVPSILSWLFHGRRSFVGIGNLDYQQYWWRSPAREMKNKLKLIIEDERQTPAVSINPNAQLAERRWNDDERQTTVPNDKGKSTINLCPPTKSSPLTNRQNPYPLWLPFCAAVKLATWPTTITENYRKAIQASDNT